jgi:predicted small lipoprotein YifL
MRPALYLVALLTGCALLGACGQKGPLFIPGDDQPPAQYQHSDAAR